MRALAHFDAGEDDAAAAALGGAGAGAASDCHSLAACVGASEGALLAALVAGRRGDARGACAATARVRELLAAPLAAARMEVGAQVAPPPPPPPVAPTHVLLYTPPGSLPALSLFSQAALRRLTLRAGQLATAEVALVTLAAATRLESALLPPLGGPSDGSAAWALGGADAQPLLKCHASMHSLPLWSAVARVESVVAARTGDGGPGAAGGGALAALRLKVAQIARKQRNLGLAARVLDSLGAGAADARHSAERSYEAALLSLAQGQGAEGLCRLWDLWRDTGGPGGGLAGLERAVRIGRKIARFMREGVPGALPPRSPSRQVAPPRVLHPKNAHQPRAPQALVPRTPSPRASGPRSKRTRPSTRGPPTWRFPEAGPRDGKPRRRGWRWTRAARRAAGAAGTARPGRRPGRRRRWWRGSCSGAVRSCTRGARGRGRSTRAGATARRLPARPRQPAGWRS